jgi:hypothetical protein
MPFQVPNYSLTGDILSFQRCALQYRYYNGSSLPPSRPVQMWTGEFVHGVLEEAYRHWLTHQSPLPWPFNQTPWPAPTTPLVRTPNDIGMLGDMVEAKLTASGKRPRSQVARDAAYNRVEAAINILAPHLFPLITAAEHRISGTRDMPLMPAGGNPARGGADRYELSGVVDVISSIGMNTQPANPLVQLVNSIATASVPDYDLIVDYKAARRPRLPMPEATTSSHWEHEEWQVQTYAWLCRQVPQSRPIGAGLLIYINELRPSRTDLVELQQEILHGRTDVVPQSGSSDYYALHQWQPGTNVPTPQLSISFRLARAIRVIDVSQSRVLNAVAQIDQVVRQIEISATQEHSTGNIPDNWTPCGSDRDCVACDFKHFCPSPAGQRVPNPPPRIPPVAPG